MWRFRQLLYVCLVLFFAVSGFSKQEAEQKSPLKFKAKHHLQDLKTDTVTLEGNVTLSYGTSELHAEKVILEKKKFYLNAIGNVRLSIPSENTYVRAHELKLNYKTQQGEMINADVQSGYSRLKAKQLFKLGHRKYRAKGATYTTCDVGDDEACPWRIWFHKGDIEFEGYATAEHPVFLAGGVPVLYSPFLFFPIKKNRQTGFLFPQFGGGQQNGFQVKNSLFIDLGRSHDATASLEYLTKRGFKEGLEYRYALGPKTEGIFDGYFIRDREFKKDFGNNNRFGVTYDHSIYFLDNLFNKARVKLISDDDFVKDFEENIEGRVDAGLETTLLQGYSNDRFSVNMEAVYYEDLLSGKPKGTNSDVTHKFPEFNFAYHETPFFGSPFLLGGSFAYVNFYNQGGSFEDSNLNSSFDNGEKILRAHRIDFFPRVSLPLKFQRYFELVPSIGLRETHWFLPVGAKGKNRSMLDITSTLTTNVHRIFNIKSNYIKKIKHLIEPRLSHSYSPFIAIDDNIPTFDGVDEIATVNKMTWGLQNRLIFKALQEESIQAKYYDGFRFDLSQDFDLIELRRDIGAPKPFSDLKSVLSTSLQRFALNTEADFNFYGDKVSRVSHGMQYTDPFTNVYRLNYTYHKKDESNSVNGGAGFHFFKKLQFNFAMNYSFDEDQFLEKIYKATYFPKSKCWALNLVFEDKVDRGMSFNVGVNLLFGQNFLSVAKLYQEGEAQNLRLLQGQGPSSDLEDL